MTHLVFPIVSNMLLDLYACHMFWLVIKILSRKFRGDTPGTFGIWAKRKKDRKWKYLINFPRLRYIAVSRNTLPYIDTPQYCAILYNILWYFSIHYNIFWYSTILLHTKQYFTIRVRSHRLAGAFVMVMERSASNKKLRIRSFTIKPIKWIKQKVLIYIKHITLYWYNFQ